VKMADCLLAEKRHRHNQNISERRRAGFPKLGHFSSHKIDQLQELYVENHGCVLYPGWISASAYKPTDESFDTIALHHTQLHDALKARREELGDVALTKDLQYLCDAMDVPLPLIPFSREAPAEYQLFTSMVQQFLRKRSGARHKQMIHQPKRKSPPLKTMIPQGKEQLRRLALSILSMLLHCLVLFQHRCHKPCMLHPMSSTVA